MTDKPRRRFMKQSAALVSGLALHGCSTGDEASAREEAPALDASVLEAVGRCVLPTADLGEDGLGRLLEDFQRWLSGFEPVAELDHPYIWTDEIAYGPPHPGPLWASQLEALELEAQKRHEQPYTTLAQEEQKAILTRQLPRDLPESLPYAGAAPHVAIGLLSYFFATSEANDLCYRAAIEEHTCRGLDTAPDEPASLGS